MQFLSSSWLYLKVGCLCKSWALKCLKWHEVASCQCLQLWWTLLSICGTFPQKIKVPPGTFFSHKMEERRKLLNIRHAEFKLCRHLCRLLLRPEVLISFKPSVSVLQIELLSCTSLFSFCGKDQFACGFTFITPPQNPAHILEFQYLIVTH